MLAVKNYIKGIENYQAHIKLNEKKEVSKRELLTEHIEHVVYYAKKIWTEKNLELMIKSFCETRWKIGSIEAEFFLQEAILGIMEWHDVGKINPQFQVEKMQNNKIKNTKEFSFVAGRHSMISAVLYLEYFLEKLKNSTIEKKEKQRIRVLLLIHTYIISRHHGDLSDFHMFEQSLAYESGRDIIEVFSEGRCEAWKKEFSLDVKRITMLTREYKEICSNEKKEEVNIAVYIYAKMIYSVLIASDFYATSEFMSGVEISDFGNIKEIEKWSSIYENTKMMQGIRKYQQTLYPQNDKILKGEKNINVLRTEMMCDAEAVLKENIHEAMFYLEAPTGSGKSNTALDLSFQLIKEDKRLKKIYYIYPFNTLVEQNMESLRNIFNDHPDVIDNIAVVNSLTPIKGIEKAKKVETKSEDTMFYQKIFLDRQFLNYPMVLSTHVSLFDTMFGDSKESAFGVHQLMNSVIILDEIQSYKNIIWGEIIRFLKEYAYLLNMKIIIMSATLPNFDLLAEESYSAINLLPEKEKYFANACFRERVKISYELLDKENVQETLLNNIKKWVKREKKILIEFIKKDTASQFYNLLLSEVSCRVEYMSGDDSIVERSRILNALKTTTDSIILVATQVVEAGVDIDMDIGYKNISKFDSEEQFLGRINRSCLRDGLVYFFKIDDGRRIYGEDIRIEPEFTLENVEIREYLQNKDFNSYYKKIIAILKHNYNEQVGEGGLQSFFTEKVGGLEWKNVKERMQLISDSNWSMSVYLSRKMKDNQGCIIDGKEIWDTYVNVLNDFKMDYAKKKVILSEVTSKMNNFIYQIKKNPDLIYDDKVGELFLIKDGEKYFENGKLNRKKIQGEVGEFTDFI